MRSDAFRRAAEAKDFSQVEELFTEDVTFKSPVVFKPYEGREALGMVLGAVVKVFEDFRYVEQVEDRRYGRARCSRHAPAIASCRGWTSCASARTTRSRELIVMVRPMSGMHALADEMKKMLEAAGAA